MPSPVSQTLVVVVHGDREHASWHVVCPITYSFKNVIDLFRDRQFSALHFTACFLNFFANNIVAQINTLVANEHRRTRNQLAHLVLAFATKRAIKQLAVVPDGVSPSFDRP